MDLYAENILDHYRHPRGKQFLPSPTFTHEEINVSCGDALTIALVLDGERVAAAGWQGTGCAISQAAASMLSEELVGKSLDALDALTAADIYGMLGVPIGSRRTKCALLCLHTLKNAIHLYKGEQMQGWSETVENAR